MEVTMRLPESRIEPVDADRYDQVCRELFGSSPRRGGKVLNVTRLWAHHPALMKAQRPMQRHLLRDSPLPPRLRELAILRIGWRCRSGYELAQHAWMGLDAGLERAELERVTVGPDADGWSVIEAAVLRAVDEMYDDNRVADETWSILNQALSVEQLIDLLSVVGRYWTVSVVLNSTGVQLEPDTLPFEHYRESGPEGDDSPSDHDNTDNRDSRDSRDNREG
jgi:alkylhydroperoxidase family enzyme